MKKLFVISFLIIGSLSAFAQGSLDKGGKQLNAGVGFSNFGVPIYVGMDFGVHESITVGPRLSYRNYNQTINGFAFNQNLIVLSFNGNYHFNKLIELPSEWDLYAGLTLGYYIWSVKDNNNNFNTNQSSGIGLDAQLGARYFFNDKVGLNLEFGGGTGNGGLFGVTIKI